MKKFHLYISSSKDTKIKKYFKKSIILLIVVIILQIPLSRIQPAKMPWSVGSLIVYKKLNIEIIYFCDSVLGHVDKDDQCKDNLLVMLGKMLPQYSVKAVASGAYGPDLYYPMCKYMIKNNYHPKVIIVPVNLRSFSSEWDKNPNYQFEEEKNCLAYDSFLFRLFYRAFQVFKLNERKVSWNDYENSPVYDGNVFAGYVKDYINLKGANDENMKKKLIFFYMSSISDKHRKIVSLKKIAQLYKNSNTKIIFYITPLDYQTGEKYLGSRFKETVQENASVIKSVLQKEGYSVIDMSVSLDSDVFSWTGWPNEHLKYEGRSFLAKMLKERITAEN